MSCQPKILVQVMLRLSLDRACLYFGGLLCPQIPNIWICLYIVSNVESLFCLRHALNSHFVVGVL